MHRSPLVAIDCCFGALGSQRKRRGQDGRDTSLRYLVLRLFNVSANRRPTLDSKSCVYMGGFAFSVDFSATTGAEKLSGGQVVDGE